MSEGGDGFGPGGVLDPYYTSQRQASVCAVDGVPITEAFGGRLVHTDELPDGVDPEHEIEPVDPGYLERREKERTDVHQLASELIAHHVVMHPMSDCVFATKLAEALRSTR